MFPFFRLLSFLVFFFVSGVHDLAGLDLGSLFTFMGYGSVFKMGACSAVFPRLSKKVGMAAVSSKVG